MRDEPPASCATSPSTSISAAPPLMHGPGPLLRDSTFVDFTIFQRAAWLCCEAWLCVACKPPRLRLDGHRRLQRLHPFRARRSPHPRAVLDEGFAAQRCVMPRVSVPLRGWVCGAVCGSVDGVLYGVRRPRAWHALSHGYGGGDGVRARARRPACARCMCPDFAKNRDSVSCVRRCVRSRFEDNGNAMRRPAGQPTTGVRARSSARMGWPP